MLSLDTSIEVKLMQPENAKFPILVTESEIETLILPLGHDIKVVLFLLYKTPSSVLKVLLSLATSIDIKPVHPIKASFSMVVTELGIVMEVKPVQPLNALNLMLVTELGIVTEVNPVQ